MGKRPLKRGDGRQVIGATFLSAQQKKPLYPGLCCGYALCVVTLYDCRPMVKMNETRACCDLYDGAYSWFLKDVQQLMPFTVRGMQGFFEVKLPDII